RPVPQIARGDRLGGSGAVRRKRGFRGSGRVLTRVSRTVRGATWVEAFRNLSLPCRASPVSAARGVPVRASSPQFLGIVPGNGPDELRERNAGSGPGAAADRAG